jgi:hypothetical protein
MVEVAPWEDPTLAGAYNSTPDVAKIEAKQTEDRTRQLNQSWFDEAVGRPLDRQGFADGTVLATRMDDVNPSTWAVQRLIDDYQLKWVDQEIQNLVGDGNYEYKEIGEGNWQVFRITPRSESKAQLTMTEGGVALERDNNLMGWLTANYGGGSATTWTTGGGGLTIHDQDILDAINEHPDFGGETTSVPASREPDQEKSQRLTELMRFQTSVRGEMSAIDQYVTDLGYTSFRHLLPQGIDANSLEHEIGGYLRELYNGDGVLSQTGIQGGQRFGGATSGSGRDPAVLTFLEKEGLKTSEVQRQLQDYLARSKGVYELQNAEQDYRFQADNYNAARAQPWTLDWGTGRRANPVRQGPRLSEVLGRTLPAEVAPDYRLNEAVGLPGAGGFTRTAWGENPWQTGSNSIRGFAEGSPTAAPGYEESLGVGRRMGKEVIRHRPGSRIIGFDQNGQVVDKGVMQ